MIRKVFVIAVWVGLAFWALDWLSDWATEREMAERCDRWAAEYTFIEGYSELSGTITPEELLRAAALDSLLIAGECS